MLRWVVRVALVVVVSMSVAGSAMAAGEPWRDASQSPAQRADELLTAMTSDQKVAMALGDYASLASLGVPTLPSDDGPSGIRADGTTSFPSAQTLAASFDRSLARAYGEAIGAEARGKGFNWWLGPAMDIARTPLAGRQPENLGEDPFLAGETVAQEVAGAKSRHVIATLKHYVANNAEWGRIGFNTPTGRAGNVNAVVSERALQEIYEAPFKRAIRESTADAVMCSYNRLNGPQTCESPALLSDLKASGFQGFVAPDFIFAVKDPLAATLAGLDVPALGGPGGRTAAMFTSGQVPAARLDDIVRRTLFAMFDSGAFDDPLGPAAANVSTPEHQALATKVSASGMVLLRNEHHALPLGGRGLRSIAVIGPSGDDAVYISGGSSAVTPAPGATVTPLAGIRARAGSAVNVTAAQGSLGDVPLTTIVPGDGGGFAASYWSNGDFSGTPALTRTDPTIDLAAAPAGVGPLWSARWTGTVTPSESGLYRFSLLQAGLATLWVDGQRVGPGYREGVQFLAGPRYPMQAAVRLTAGKPASIRIDYSSSAQLFGAQVHLAWQPPSASGIPAAVEAARHADAAIVLANNGQGEGMDRTTLALPGDQDQLIDAVAAVNRRTIVVLDTGGPVLMPWLHHVEGVLQAWYPGQQFGAALAPVLFGDSDPGGRLPITFPASDAQGPAPPTRPERYPGVNGAQHYDEGIFVGYRWYDQFRQQPLFPFGYGLSYADFRFGHVRLRFDHGGVTATTRVTNTSRRAGSTVAQAYLSFPRSTGEPPRQLKGYEKVELAPGRSAVVSFRLDRADLAYFDEGAHRQVVAGGRYTLSVGGSSRDLPESASFELGGRDHH
ncbi:MAG TPA: glycoside hydrolase family 3 C-terminal domain-containing protein [Solirubrobacteraceae bacterium]